MARRCKWGTCAIRKTLNAYGEILAPRVNATELEAGNGGVISKRLRLNNTAPMTTWRRAPLKN